MAVVSMLEATYEDGKVKVFIDFESTTGAVLRVRAVHGGTRGNLFVKFTNGGSSAASTMSPGTSNLSVSGVTGTVVGSEIRLSTAASIEERYPA